MKKVVISTLAGAALLASSAALAMGGSNPTQGSSPYLNGQLGAVYTPRITLAKSGTKAKTNFNWGWNALGAIGYRYQNWRADISVGYIYNGLDNVKVTGAAAGNSKHSADGEMRAIPYLANLYYDIDTTTNFVPYVGAGLGGAYLDLDSDIKTTGVKFSDTDNVFAYQGVIGLAYQFSPNMRADINYHYFLTSNASFKLKVNNGTNKYSLREKYQSNLFNLGFTYMFNV